MTAMHETPMIHEKPHEKPARLEAMTAVYTYFFPEVRGIVRLPERLPSGLFLTTTPVEEAQRAFDALGFKERIVIPATVSGTVNLDELHEPIIDRMCELYRAAVPGLGSFKGRYFTSGSSEGIFHVIADLRAKGVDEIFTLPGEYEGYKAYALSLGLGAREVDLDQARRTQGKHWFVSNPSARDGNLLPERFVQDLYENDNKVHLDLAYVGSTKPHAFPVLHPGIESVFLSMSKPYGVFRYRIGFTFTRGPMDSLYGNKWFKDIGRLVTGLKLAEDIGPGGLYDHYAPVQQRIVEDLSREQGIPLQASDVLLLSYVPAAAVVNLDDRQKELLAPYARAEGYRLCLTPYFEHAERT